MCTVSMIFDHYQDKWTTQVVPNYIYSTPQIPQHEIDEFKRLLERARKYDSDNNQPDCELDEKRLAIRRIAQQLGVDIAFL